MPRCKEKTNVGKRCKSNSVKHFDFCFNHSPNCSICLEKLVSKGTQIVFCNHEFHHDCIEKWLEKENTCPICRNLIDHSIILDDSIKEEDVCPNFTSQILLMMTNLPLKPMTVRVFLDENKNISIKTS
jgi:hypothetical protein